MKIIIGIDPGASGAIAVLEGERLRTYNMPDTYPDIYALLGSIRKQYDLADVVAVMEDVGHGMPSQSSRATAVFARHNGHLEMALYAVGIPARQVTPQKWMKHYSNSLGRSKDCEKREWKNKLKGLAQRMFPSEKVTLKNADAILLANYGADLLLHGRETSSPSNSKNKVTANKSANAESPGLFD